MKNNRKLASITEADKEQTLPQNLDAEQLVLGAGMINEVQFLEVAARLEEKDFSIFKHQLIFRRMVEIYDRGEMPDRVTLANELQKHSIGPERTELQSVDGLSYLVSLDDGLPHIYNLGGYIKIVKEKSDLRKIITLSQDTISRCEEQSTRPHDIAADLEEQLLGFSVPPEASTSSLMRPGEIAGNFKEGINAFLDVRLRQKVYGVQTGFVRFDEMTGGFQPDELIILAARPGMGKTALALNIACNIALHKSPEKRKAVVMFSLEMSKESLLVRALCSGLDLDQQRYKHGLLHPSDLERLHRRMAAIADAPLFIDDTPGTTLMDIHAKCRRLKAQLEHEGIELGLVVIDYLQLMQTRGRFENRVQEISNLSRGCKLMSKTLHVPFLVLSQLSRAPETRTGDHRPVLSDLRESGSIEQDADMVAFVYREVEYLKNLDDNDERKVRAKHEAELILAKQRNGPTGKVDLYYADHSTTFRNPEFANLEEPAQEPAPVRDNVVVLTARQQAQWWDD